MNLCDHKCQGYGLCQLVAGHKGRHTTEVFVCDICGERRRGRPTFESYSQDGDTLRFCFLCAPPSTANLSPTLLRKTEDYY